MNILCRVVITFLVGAWLALNAFVSPVAQVINDPPPPMDAFAAAKREVWEQLLQLGTFDQNRHALLLDPEPIGIDRYRVRAMRTAASPTDADVLLAEATWQEAARYQSEMANLYANRYREVMPNFVSGAFHFIAGTLEYQGRLRDVWVMVQDLTINAQSGETVRMVAFIPAGIGTLSFVITEAYDAATVGLRGSGEGGPWGPVEPKRVVAGKSSSDGYVDPRYKCRCWHALPPNSHRKWIDTEQLPGPGPSQPPLPIPNLASYEPPNHWQRVVWPDPNPLAIAERNECRSRCWREQILNLIIGGSLTAGYVAGCGRVFFIPLVGIASGVFCLTAVAVAAGYSWWAISNHVDICQETCNVPYCQIVARDSKRTWMQERDSFRPQLAAAMAARDEIQREITRVNARIYEVQRDLALAPPAERHAIAQLLAQLQEQMRALIESLRQAEQLILAAHRAMEPSQNKITAVDACIQTPVGADR